MAHVVADAIRARYDYPGTLVDALARHAARFGLRRGDGLALLRWLLDLVGDPDTPRWMEEAQAHLAHASSDAKEPDTVPPHAVEGRV